MLKRRGSGGWMPALVFALSMGAAGCKAHDATKPPARSVEHRRVADMLHAVMEADRTTYTREVVDRLVHVEKVQIVDPKTNEPAPFLASEEWKSEHGKLPLPAQMFRMGAEAVAEKNIGFTYSLLSKWPVNKKNGAKTPLEADGLDFVSKEKGQAPFYGEEELGGKLYFAAIYPDVAVAKACIECHNAHEDSPRSDFELGDVMGGVVIRIPIDG